MPEGNGLLVLSALGAQQQAGWQAARQTGSQADGRTAQ